MKNTPQNIRLFYLCSMSALLVACGEGAITPPNHDQPSVKLVPLNDTGVIYAINDANTKISVTKPDLDGNLIQSIDTSGNLEYLGIQTIYTNFVNDFPNDTDVIQGAPTGFPGQDVNFGRDINAATNDPSDGRLGFSFTKLDKDNGSALDPAATEFGCVRDNVTGLIWENKIEDKLQDLSAYHKLHRSKARHNWYDPNPLTNGGDSGQLAASSSCATIENDTYTFVQAVNTENLCGISNWRIPTSEELRSLVDYGVKDGSTTNPMVDPLYFRFIGLEDHRWTSQTEGPNKERAYGFHFYEGRMQSHSKSCTVDTVNSGGVTVKGNQDAFHNGTVLVSGVYD